MTLIMGASCKDGVFLIADKKFTYSDGSQPDYGNKITGEIGGMLTAFSGDRGTFELFRNRLRDYVRTSEKNDERSTSDIDEIL
jgi:20S proteasome alpha/beta subunit